MKKSILPADDPDRAGPVHEGLQKISDMACQFRNIVGPRRDDEIQSVCAAGARRQGTSTVNA